MPNHLELVQRERSGGRGRTQRSWLDFVVDGTSLYETFGAGDFIGRLGWGDTKLQAESLRELLQSDRFVPAKRTMIFVCAECGDLGCGAITVAIRRDEGEIVWDRFGFQNGAGSELIEAYVHVGPFRFSVDQYWQALGVRREVGA